MLALRASAVSLLHVGNKQILRQFSIASCTRISAGKIVVNNQVLRQFTTTNTPFSDAKVGFYGPIQHENFIKRIARKFGWSETSKFELKSAGYNIYTKIADEVDYESFFKACEMEDTFQSWFTVLELHVWMLSARLMEEGAHGKKIRNAVMEALWKDNDMKSKRLEGAIASARKQQLVSLSQGFNASLMSYDEGLLGNDKVLAGALWRNFLRSKEPANQEELLKQIVSLELLVLYVRCQFKLLNTLSREKLIKTQDFTFLPFNDSLFEAAEKMRTTAS